MLQHLARIAVAHECGRFEWSVLDWNEPAIHFYKGLGAVAMDEWTRDRLAGQALADFAGGGVGPQQRQDWEAPGSLAGPPGSQK